MTDVWDISQYVEAHPENHAQRWRLAKKLYLAWEYRLALEHLLVLKNEWEKKKNVSRYLAATYYRLSRYEDAVGELTESVKEWPSDINMREQLARTLNASGDKSGAIRAWLEIADLDPHHPFAERALEELRAEATGKLRAGSPAHAQGASELGAEQFVAAEITCPSCGSMNNAEFRRCWQCHAELDKLTMSAEPAGDESVEEEGFPWPMVAGLTFVALLALGVYLALRAYTAGEGALEGSLTPVSVFEFISQSTIWTRIVLGATLVIVWPLMWRMGAHLVGADNLYSDVLHRCGGILAVGTFVLMWLPPGYLWSLFVAPPLVSLVFAGLLLRDKRKAALGLWVFQLLMPLFISAVIAAGMNGPGVFLGAQEMRRFASENVKPTTFQYEGVSPVLLNLSWEATGAAWLDEHGATIGIVIETGAHDKRMFAELGFVGEKPDVFRQFTSTQYGFEYTPIEPAKEYRLSITGENGTLVKISLRGIMPISASDLVRLAPSS